VKPQNRSWPKIVFVEEMKFIKERKQHFGFLPKNWEKINLVLFTLYSRVLGYFSLFGGI
jgi:hypothetical protein